ncbi:unnamed protein product [Toxocara canis]|uniref:Peroxidasin-like protein n=1 Tax=Toxocara canis TaxID=6265 RepID=A0A183U1F2_TOXCA|nr:unnamed protein product [Toxocara canis]
MTDEFRDKLFKGAGNLGLDLAALILQTGRDHGVPPYTVWRQYCGGGKVNTWDDLIDDVVGGAETIRRLARCFKSVEDVDLFILGLAEKPLHGALVGATFSCIISLQFQKTKRGDRFWYENDLSPSGFTEEQLTEIKKTTMAQVICDNTEYMERIQPMAFQAIDAYDNYPLLCNNSLLAGPDFSKWRDDAPKLEMPITTASVEKALALGKLEVEERRKKEERNIRRNQQDFKSGDPLLSYGKMMRAKREALEVAKVSDVLLQTTKILMSGGGLDNGEKLPLQLDISTLQRLLPQIDVSTFVGNFTAFLGPGGSVDKCLPKNLPCDHTTPYRTASGWCNNLRNPHFANAFGPLLHLLPPAYEDGIDSPRSMSVLGVQLPSARAISNAVHFDRPYDHHKFTHMLMQFGQFLDHDMTHSPTERGCFFDITHNSFNSRSGFVSC